MYIRKEENRGRELDYNNFNLGKYMMFAFNQPADYPDKPFTKQLEEEKEDGVMTGEEMERVARRNTIILGGKIKWQSK